MDEYKKPKPTTRKGRYHPLKEIFTRQKKSFTEKIREIDVSDDKWWAYALKGIVSIVFGVILIAWPEESLLFLVVVFGIQALAKGIIGLVHAISLAVKKDRWVLVLLESVVGLLLGAALVAQPHASLELAAVLIGIWMIATGLSQLAIAYRDSSKAKKRLVGVGGLLSVIFGVLLVAVPIETVHLAHTLSAVQALALGIIFIIVGFYMPFQSYKSRTEGASSASSPTEGAGQE